MNLSQLLQLVFTVWSALRRIKASAWFTVLVLLPCALGYLLSSIAVILDPNFGARVSFALYLVTFPMIALTLLQIARSER
ncbi:MAG: hypothetical protein MUC92_10220 [Fimbriimonadaceae bacterium]|nr:hypothetical protein [Fimbriimonadaceae bacterium]